MSEMDKTIEKLKRSKKKTQDALSKVYVKYVNMPNENMSNILTLQQSNVKGLFPFNYPYH